MQKEKLIIVKVGGNIIDAEDKLQTFLEAFAAIRANKILVHGGGKMATALATKMGIEQQMIEGRRITDAETLKIVTMVYAGFINKNIVAGLQAYGCNALGLCGADGNIIAAHKRVNDTIDYGFAGDIDLIDSEMIGYFLSGNLTPVIAPITHDAKGQLLNTNADTIAQALATAMAKKYEVDLLYCFEKRGVLKDISDEASVVNKITPSIYEAMKKQELISAGMTPKLDNAFAAIDSGVNKVVIGDAAEIEKLIAGTSGTSIARE
ncbi:MAG: acetylglutamate kinase [Ferruginibacter sp.]